VKWFYRGCLKDPGYLTQPVILGNLELLDEPFLLHPGIPYLSAVREPRDDERIVNLSPIEEVESADGITEDVYAPYIGAGAVGHNGDVPCPIEAVIDIYPEISEMRYRGDVVGA
jgi:hypothetical protein